MFRHTGVKRSRLFQAQESGESLGRDATAPKGAVDPVADLAFSVRRPAADVPGDLVACENRLCQILLVGQKFRLMLMESFPLARIKRDHCHGHGVPLVFKEERQVARFDIA